MCPSIAARAGSALSRLSIRWALMVLLVLCCGVVWAEASIPPLTSPVVDTTGTLDAAQIAQLEQQARDLQQRKGSQLQILIVPSTQPEDIAAYAQRAFDAWKLGRAKVDDGVLLVVAKDDRRVRIQTGYGLEGAIPDITAGRVIQEYLVPKFRAGDYAGGIVDGSAVLVKLIDGEPLPEPMAFADRGGGPDAWILPLFFAFIGATFTRGLFSSASSGVRSLFTGGVAGMVAWFVSSSWLLAAFAAAAGLFYGVLTVSRGRYSRDRGWGGYDGGWGGGSSSSGGGGGWSGGGGSSGGGGASGSW